MTIDKVLVPHDFSRHSSSALQYAADIARHCNAKLELIHVFDLGLYSLTDGMSLSAAEQLQPLATDMEQRLESAKRHAIAAGVQRVHAKLLLGTPEAEILKLAKQGAFALIVMGTHGRSGFRRSALGSVAERVVRYAPCPVFTVKAFASKETTTSDSRQEARP